MSEAFDGLVKPLIENYMNENIGFQTDLQQMNHKLVENNANNGLYAPIVTFCHQMDVNSVVDSNTHDFSEYLLENEKQFSKLFEKRLKRRIGKTVLNGRKVWFCLKYKNLPENLIIKCFTDSRIKELNLFSIQDLQIVSMTQCLNSLIASKYTAIDDKRSEEPIKWKIRGIHETRDDLKTSEKYIESESERMYAKIRFIMGTIGRNERSGWNPMTIIINYKLFDEREVECLYNGSHFDSVVVLKTNSSELILLSFEKFCQPISPLNVKHNTIELVSLFPQEIQELFEDRKQSKFGFALSLAFIFADNICISGSFFRLKLGLLLSILSLNDCPKRNLSSVLVICDDTLMIRRLFEWSSLFSADRYLHTSSLFPMTGSARMVSNNEWIDAGVLQLGADGITVINSSCNLNDLPQKERTSLFHALETNEVIARQSQPKVHALNESELKTTIWAVIEDDIDERQFKKPLSKSQTILWTEVFGMVYTIREESDDYFYEQLGESTLSFGVWQQILQLINQIRPQMSPTAGQLLQSYYVTNRRIRGSVFKRISMESLVSLSKGFAKLSLRSEITKSDALMAILLFEESLITRVPQLMSPLGVQPLFHVREEDMHLAIGPNCDQYMREFEQRLNSFINELKPKTDNNTVFQNEE